jgi:Domain of unknown function (DUF5658)
MRTLCTRWERSGGWFGDVVVIGFLIVQSLDGAFTYLGVKTWGLSIEANPLVSSAVHALGLGVGLAGVKLLAVSLGIMLHLRRVHALVAALTALYVAVAIVPWTALFLAN